MKMFVVLQDDNGNEYRHELTSKEVKKHQYGFEIAKPKKGKLYDAPIKIGNYELRTNSAIFFINDTDIINEDTTENRPLKRSDFSGLNITATRRKLGLKGSPIAGETKEDLLNRYFGSKVEPKTAKVEPKTAKVETGSIGEKLAQLFAQGKISETAYLQQISLLNL